MFLQDNENANGHKESNGSNGFGYRSSGHDQDDEISAAHFVRTLSQDQVCLIKNDQRGKTVIKLRQQKTMNEKKRTNNKIK